MKVSENFTGTYGTMYFVRDMDKSIAYYKDMFDLEPTEKSPGWTTYNFGGHELCLHIAEEGQSIDGKGILINRVKNLQGVYEELKSRGVEFMNEIHQVCDGGYAVDYKDPSGNQISLFEYTGQ